MPYSVTQPEPRVVFGTVILPFPVHPRASTKVQGTMNSSAVSAASQVTCLHFHTSPTRRICCLLLYCWEKWTRACWWPHRIVHCGSCSVKCTGRSVSKGQFSLWPYLLYGASIHLLLWEGSPLPLAINFSASPLNELCIPGWDGPHPSPAGDMDVLAKKPWRILWSSPVQGPLMSSEAAVVGVLAQCLTSHEPTRHPSMAEVLIKSVLYYPEPQPRAHMKKWCFQDQRGALNAECYSGLPSSSCVISLPSAPLKS